MGPVISSPAPPAFPPTAQGAMTRAATSSCSTSTANFLCAAHRQPWPKAPLLDRPPGAAKLTPRRALRLPCHCGSANSRAAPGIGWDYDAIRQPGSRSGRVKIRNHPRRDRGRRTSAKGPAVEPSPVHRRGIAAAIEDVSAHVASSSRRAQGRAPRDESQQSD